MQCGRHCRAAPSLVSVAGANVTTMTDADFANPFAPPTADALARMREDLVGRVLCVQRNGWDDYRYTWATGEVLAVAVITRAEDILAAHGETEDSVYARWAYDLWGAIGGETDTARGCPETRAWFDQAAAEAYRRGSVH